MNKIEKCQNQEHDLEEIDIVEISLRMWCKRIFIVKTTAIFVALGLLIAIFSPVQYTSKCVIMPQTSGVSLSNSSIGSLAQLAGFSLGNIGSEEVLSPTVYKNILNNINLQKELSTTPLFFEKFGREITLLDYFSLDEYIPFSLKRYTIGLPGLIMESIRGKAEDNPNLVSAGGDIEYYTQDEMKYVRAMDGVVSLEIDDETACVTISATMPEAILSAQLVMRVQELLQRYITEFKINKAMASYDFIKQRYDEAKVDYEVKQLAYAKFQDANRLLSSASSKIQESALQSDFDIASSTFNELAVQLIQAEIKVKEDTPTFTIIEPVMIPREKSAPKRVLILMIFTLFGGVVACGLVLFLDFIKGDDRVGVKCLKDWN